MCSPVRTRTRALPCVHTRAPHPDTLALPASLCICIYTHLLHTRSAAQAGRQGSAERERLAAWVGAQAGCVGGPAGWTLLCGWGESGVVQHVLGCAWASLASTREQQQLLSSVVAPRSCQTSPERETAPPTMVSRLPLESSAEAVAWGPMTRWPSLLEPRGHSVLPLGGQGGGTSF